MSLKAFHIAFVTLSSLLAFLFGGWNLRAFGVSGSTGNMLAALCAFAFGGGLIVYGVWFRRKVTTLEGEDRRRRNLLRPLPVVLAVLLFGQRTAEACSVCYGDAEGPMIDAAKLGVYLLFGLVLVVQGAFVAFFVYLRRQDRAHNGPVKPWWVES